MKKVKLPKCLYTIFGVMRFKFIHKKQVILDKRATPYYPRTNNFVWIDSKRYQVTSVHIDYENNEMRFYCA